MKMKKNKTVVALECELVVGEKKTTTTTTDQTALFKGGVDEIYCHGV